MFLSCLISFKVANPYSLKLGITTILLQICKSLVNLVQNHQNNKNFNHLSQDIQDSSSHSKLIQTWKLGFEHTNKNHSNNHGKHHQSSLKQQCIAQNKKKIHPLKSMSWPAPPLPPPGGRPPPITTTNMKFLLYNT